MTDGIAMKENKRTVRITDASYQILEKRDKKRFPAIGAYASYLVETAVQLLEDKEQAEDKMWGSELLREVQAIRKGQENLENEVKKLYQLLDRRLGFENNELFDLLDPSKE